MNKRLYVAYGSNLNIEQMKYRCPDAKIIGTATLRDWELLFKGSKTGSYLTIERRKGGRVPVALWSVSERDEAMLDRYEGFPTFYYKRSVRLTMTDSETLVKRRVTAFVYIMHEERPIGVPSMYYVQTCMDGYNAFGFDRQVLIDAYNNSKSRMQRGA